MKRLATTPHLLPALAPRSVPSDQSRVILAKEIETAALEKSSAAADASAVETGVSRLV